ncbi:LLM class flavin-dependent oxidoreductase [Knoellia sp. CPCC 206450]|uniref:LLM class flavin-dependent oxidoreductase n=1 Tax=Knoellia tibetensis TaxID=3404798 RepID=UPI003B432CFD
MSLLADAEAGTRDARPAGLPTELPVGVLFGQQVDELEPLVDHARLCAEEGSRLWMGQSMTVETHLALAAVAGRGIRVDTGLAVAVAPLTTPALAWAQARSIAALMGRSISACYGIGSLAAAQAIRGEPMPSPARWMRDFVGSVGALREDALRHPGTEGLPEIELGCGVLRPTMARRAAEVSEVVVTWLTPTEHLAATLVPALDRGAAAAARPRPRVVAIVPCAVRRPGRDPVRLAATALGQHIRLPHYAQMLRGAGVDLRGERAHDLRATLRSGLFAWGEPEQIRATLLAHVAAGADEVVLHLGSVGLVHGHRAALADLREILAALDDVRHGGAARPTAASAGPTTLHHP